MAKQSRKIDNPLLQSTENKQDAVKAVEEQPVVVEKVAPPPTPSPAERIEVKSKLAAVKREIAKPKYFMSPDDEKASVFEIIQDLEKQLESGFSLKKIQDREIASITQQLESAEEKAAALEVKVIEFRKVLISQEELNSELEFLENEKLESVEKLRVFEDELRQKDIENNNLTETIEVLNKDLESKDSRIDQIELDLSSTNTIIKNLQNTIDILEDEKEILSNNFQECESEVHKLIAERDKCKKDLVVAKESLDEIRLMLADTRTKARGRYYSKKAKV